MAATTQSQLARKLGLSRSTVAAALNPHSPVKLSEETRERILREAGRSNYRPHRYAQIMRVGKSRLIGVFHFGGLYQVAAERAWYASHAIQSAGYQVLTSDASWTMNGVKSGCEAMLDARVEGVIVAGLNDPASVNELKALQAAGIPIVMLSGNEFPGAPQVRADVQKAFQRLTVHLLERGRKRLLLLFSVEQSVLPGAKTWTGEERLKGFKAALSAASVPLVEKFSRRSTPGAQGCIAGEHIATNPFDPFRRASETMRAMLEHEPRPDAIICSNDDWAIGALSALRHAGLSVPGDVAVTGFDNSAIGAYLEVPLTSVAQPSKAMAEKAVELLLQKIHGKRTPSAPVKFPCELVVRESCGARRSAYAN